jgi:hypothetical protein
MKSFLFSSVLGAGLGIVIGSQILKGDHLSFTTEAGPAVTTVARPMKFAAKKRPASAVAAKKPVKKRIARKRVRRHSISQETATSRAESASIASLVSRGLGQ